MAAANSTVMSVVFSDGGVDIPNTAIEGLKEFFSSLGELDAMIDVYKTNSEIFLVTGKGMFGWKVIGDEFPNVLKRIERKSTYPILKVDSSYLRKVLKRVSIADKSSLPVVIFSIQGEGSEDGKQSILTIRSTGSSGIVARELMPCIYPEVEDVTFVIDRDNIIKILNAVQSTVVELEIDKVKCMVTVRDDDYVSIIPWSARQEQPDAVSTEEKDELVIMNEGGSIEQEAVIEEDEVEEIREEFSEKNIDDLLKDELSDG